MSFKLLSSIAVLCAALTLAPFIRSKKAVPADYENWTAQEKAQYQWQTILADNNTPAPWFNVLEILGLFTESDSPTINLVSDFFPEGRNKLIHSVGAAALITFVWDGEDYGYTGLFNYSQGSVKYGLLRASSATQPTSTSITPGISVKLFRDGVPSGNFLAMWQLDGQANDFNFFTHVLSNHVPNRADLPLQIKALGAKFRSVSAWPTLVGLSEVASVDQFGTSVASPFFPFALVFQPNPAIQDRFAANATNDIPSLFSHSFSGDETLWKVYAVPDSSVEPTLQYLGHVKLTTPFAASKYADRGIFYKHTAIEKDLAIRQDWLEQVENSTRIEQEGAQYYQDYLPAY